MMKANVAGIPEVPIVELSESQDTQESQEEHDTPKTGIENLAELLETLEDAPGIITLESWQDKFSALYSSTVTGEDVYVWRVVNRSEYKKIVGSMNQESTTSSHLEDAIVRKCLLFPEPRIDFIATSSAGVIPTIFEQIMYQSGFVPKEAALRMIRKI